MSEQDKDSPFHRFRRAGATPHQLRMVAEALRASPQLNRAMTEAIRSGDLVSIRLLPASAAERNGEYDPYHREIRLRSDLLNVAPKGEHVDKLVDVLAHETRHALQLDEINGFDARMLVARRLSGRARGRASGPPSSATTSLSDGGWKHWPSWTASTLWPIASGGKPTGQ